MWSRLRPPVADESGATRSSTRPLQSTHKSRKSPAFTATSAAGSRNINNHVHLAQRNIQKKKKRERREKSLRCQKMHAGESTTSLKTSKKQDKAAKLEQTAFSQAFIFVCALRVSTGSKINEKKEKFIERSVRPPCELMY